MVASIAVRCSRVRRPYFSSAIALLTRQRNICTSEAKLGRERNHTDLATMIAGFFTRQLSPWIDEEGIPTGRA
jgi:hypothetical protein